MKQLQINNDNKLNLDNIDPNKIKSMDEFAFLYLGKYGNNTSNQIKIKEIISYVNSLSNKCNLTKIYLEIRLVEWKFGGPELAEIKGIIYNSKIIDDREKNYSNFLEKKDGENGEWLCKGCKGKLGYLKTEIKRSGPYEFFYKCKVCDGSGYSKDNMYWVSYEYTLEDLNKKVEEFNK